MTHPEGKHIVVIGAGIVGASLAYHLAVKGAKVTVVEAQDIASGVTGTSFGWINTTRRAPDPIAALRSTAISEFHRLEAQLPDLKIQWAGSLCYGADTDEALPASSHQSPAFRVARSRVLELEPHLKNPPEQALYKAEEGALDPAQATHTLIAGAKAQGAEVRTHTQVLGFTTRHGQVVAVDTTAGRLEADVVVIAAGTGLKTLTGLLGMPLPVEASPSIFIRYTAHPGVVRTLVSNTEMEVRQTPQGAVWAAQDYLGDALQDAPSVLAQQLGEVIHKAFDGIGPMDLQTACVGLRPIAVDGLPVIGYLPTVGGVYVCAMHPGVTLAAAVGRLACEEIIDGTPSSLLEPCRPGRFKPEPGASEAR